MKKFQDIILFFLSVLAISAAMYFSKASGDWIGFWGNIFAGILTIAGVKYAFNLDKEREYINQLPGKIVNIQEIKGVIQQHKFPPSSLSKLITAVSYEETALRFTQDIEDMLASISSFGNSKENLLSKAATVDTDSFNAVQTYFDCLKVIEKQIEIQQKITIDKEDIKNGYDGIVNAKEFHAYTTESLDKILDNKEEFYLNYLHKKKKSQEIIQQFNDHPYLKDIKNKISK